MDSNSFEKAINVLNDLERKGYMRRYAIGGAVGAMFYIEPIDTEDVDIFIFVTEERDKSFTPLEDIYAYLREKGYSAEKEYVNIEGGLFQFLMASEPPLLHEALEKAVEISFGQTTTKVMLPEYLVALMLDAGRPKDFVKINYLLEQTIDFDYPRLDYICKKFGLTEKWARFEGNRQ